MINCEFCGKEFETDKQLKGHQISCRKQHQDDGTGSTSPADKPEPDYGTVSIPLTICPPELAYMMENRQMFLRIAGRKMGDRFIIEGVKVVR